MKKGQLSSRSERDGKLRRTETKGGEMTGKVGRAATSRGVVGRGRVMGR